MSSEDEKAAIQARLYESIKRNGPGWQAASIDHFLLQASAITQPEQPAANPPIIYLPGLTAGADKSDNSRIKASSGGEGGVLGQDIETGREVCIGDEERCGGLYVLGKPRTGKSNLLLRLALSDINNGRGILFIDPHTDAINDLRDRIPDFRQKDVILLDPTDKERSFGIDLLRCEDRENPLALDAAWGRISDIFVKVWEQERGQLGFWLDKILRNSVYILLENPGVTMVELPLLLIKDTAFRDSLLANMKIKPFVKDFWHYEFDRLSERDRTEQVGPALNRLSVLRDIDIVRDIVGQGNPKINFREILRDNKIVLLRLSVNLASDVRNLLGTMILSEVSHAPFERAERTNDERPYFGIYCDEFQEFATPDFAKLFTQTGKYKVMPVVAHQTRAGQFKPGDPNQGATLAAPNKVLFTLSSPDARELALEFAEDPQTERYVISQQPVRDLLEGHHNPKICKFVNKYLRFLDDKRDDIKAEREGVKFARMIELDTAAIYGVEAQGEGIAGPSHYAAQASAVSARQTALLRARMHSINLAALHEKANLLRVTMRALNRFLTQVMEGEVSAEQDAFADFLISLASSYSALPEAYAQVLGLYIKCSYGDPDLPRTIPFDLARSRGLFPGEVFALTFEAQKKTEEERRTFEARYMREEEEQRARSRMREREYKVLDQRRAMEGKIVLMNRRCSEIGGGRTGTRGNNIRREEDFIWYPANVYTWFIWLKSVADIEKLVSPYRTAKFTDGWKDLLVDGDAAKTITKLDNSLTLVKRWEYGYQEYMEFMRARVVRDLKQFLHRYQEGALVMLALADCAGKGGWRFGQDGDISLTEFPGIQGQDPVEVWCVIERLRVLLRKALGARTFSSLFSKYFNEYVEYSYDEFDQKLN